MKEKINKRLKRCRCGRRITHHHFKCDKCWNCATKRGVSELKLSKAQSPNISLKESANTDSQISDKSETSLNNNIKQNSKEER
jgi:sulfur relay (sulfurtransferase) complex TusBCD TusD component (DsrE family)